MTVWDELVGQDDGTYRYAVSVDMEPFRSSLESLAPRGDAAILKSPECV